MPPAFEILRLAGAVYLIYLGLQLLLAPGGPLGLRDAAAASPGQHTRRAFVEGMQCELSNPKTLVVFTSVIPSS